LGGSLTIGKPGRSVTINNTAANIACVIDVLPGNQGSTEIAAGNFNICGLPGSMLTNQGRIKNVLAGQTITLALNIGGSSGLANFALQAGTFYTADLVGDCGSIVAETRVCNYSPIAPYPLVSVTNQYTSRTISQAVYDALPTKNVAGLLELANRALGNVDGVAGSEAGVSLDAIQEAVAAINEGFDECAAFVGWNVAPCPAFNPNPPVIRITTQPIAEVTSLNVSAYPNPFTDKVTFVIRSQVTGQGSLEIYNMLGQRIQTVYNGTIVANRAHTVEYKVSSKNLNGGLIYIFKQGGQQVTGKLLNLE